MNTDWALQPPAASHEIESIQHRDFRSVPALLALLMASAWLAGCSTPKAPPSVTPRVAQDAAATAPGATATPARPAGAYAWTTSMGDTSQRLRGALSGGAVEVSQTTDLRLWLSMPVDAAFDKGRSAVKPQATAQLDQVALALRANLRAQVQIVGEADVVGAGATNLALDRAASARDWLVARGIVASRIGVGGRTARGAPAADTPRLDILIGERAGPTTPAPPPPR
jgi:outer membrane protein OmpA-like peptidoglycan-associated protein